MTSAHEGMRELLGLYVLGAVTAAEAAEFEAHFAGCEACRVEMAALRPVAAGLARIATQVDPPAGLRERVIRAATGRPVVQGEAAAGVSASVAAVLPWLLAAASLVIALGLGGYSVQLRGRLTDVEGQLAVLAAPDLVRFDLAGQPNAPAAAARAFWSRSRGMVLTASNLPSPPAGRVYQLWVLTAAGAPISVGLLEPDQAGALTAVFQTPVDIPVPTQVAVSDEPAGGAPAPTGMIWVAGKPAT